MNSGSLCQWGGSVNSAYSICSLFQKSDINNLFPDITFSSVTSSMSRSMRLSDHAYKQFEALRSGPLDIIVVP